MIKLFAFDTNGKIPGQVKIIYPAETSQEAFLNLLRDLPLTYGSEANSLVEQINTIPKELLLS